MNGTVYPHAFRVSRKNRAENKETCAHCPRERFYTVFVGDLDDYIGEETEMACNLCLESEYGNVPVVGTLCVVGEQSEGGEP